MPGGLQKVWSNPFVRKGLIAGGGAVLVYTLFGFLALPAILKSVLSKTLTETLHRKAELREIRVNQHRIIPPSRHPVSSRDRSSLA